jgi:hypothetical protein
MRIEAECIFVDEHGAVGIRLEPAAANMASNSGPHGDSGVAVGETATSPLSGEFFLHLTFATRKPLNRLARGTPSKVLIFEHGGSSQTAMSAALGCFRR